MHINASSKKISILILIFIIYVFPLNAAIDSKKSPPLAMPDVLVWISSVNPASTYVSVTFPKVIPQTQAEVLLAGILKETGWTANNINITSDKPSDNDGNPMTSIEFMFSQSAIYSDGSLPIEPLVKALKEMKSMQILVMTYPGFKYTGTGGFENRYVKLSLVTGQNSYNFNIDIKDSNFQDPGFPKVKTGIQNEQVNQPAVGWGIITLIFILAISAATVVFFFMKRLQIKKQQ